MNSPPSLKRKRDNGHDMSQFREVVDDETGERIKVRVDTTKSAKKRAKKAGGAQWQPTAGQIKAAELWNKQEEKIRKDKDREEKRKKAAVRQTAKDVKIREQQEELLSKGRITIEDTWGKVSASQNRLNKFFTTPKKSVQRQQEPESEDDSDEDVGRAVSPVKDAPRVDTLAQPTMLQDNDKPPSPRADATINRATTSMLPPPLPAKNSRAALSPESRSAEAFRQIEPAPAGSVPVFLSTQDVSNLFADIGSQDLEDDLTDSQNESPPAETAHALPANVTEDVQVTSREALPIEASAVKRKHEDIEDEEFDDGDVDDETLMYFAATQHVAKRARLDTNSEPNSPSSATTVVLDSDSPTKPAVSPTLLYKSRKRSFGVAADSFVFTDVDDSDLVQCVEDFERTDGAIEADHDDDNGSDSKGTIPQSSSESFFQGDRIGLSDEDLLKAVEAVEEQAGIGSQGSRPTKRRRVLPWVKFPEIYAIAEGIVEEVSASASLLQT